MSYRTNTCGELRSEQVDKIVTLAGWVHKRRNLGGLIFVDLRDRYGITQIVFNPDITANFALADTLKYEYVIKVTGTIVARVPEAVNKDLLTGAIELKAQKLEILSQAKTLPFEIFDAHKEEEDEELRLKYRYLELRREHLKNNIIFRAKMIQYIRAYMDARDFLEISTPILTVSSPEGARDFLVPSRIHPGKFYALPQAPQQYKQLLMVAGMDRYYQIAPCMRDEDPRADRSPGEFYQLDVETSFLERDEFFDLMEPLFIELTEKVAGKIVQQNPFPRLPYQYVLDTYGTDRPDLRYDLKIVDVTDWAKNTDFKVFVEAKAVRVIVVPSGAQFTRKEIDEEFTELAKRNKAKGLAWLKYTTDFEGTIVKFFKPEELNELRDKLKIKTNDILFFVADEPLLASKVLGAVRTLAAEKLHLADPNVIAWAWIVDFPMYEWSPDKVGISGEAGAIDFGHNPFSLPQGGLDTLNSKDPLTILADQYDIIANGLELSSGAVRNKDPEIMYRAFEIAGYTRDAVNKKFGHMIDAFEYGAPPHCGFAPGIDRLLMLFLGEPNIRAVIPFPKNQHAEEPMMGSPSTVDDRQLRDLHIRSTD
ncbi:MAG: aspartate--tRNA ligase [Candidatus Magasanikbacteria bacterium RIFCSPHIGHO2_01_FULL_41_23]|uniref:Aspartate--tRNA ligase n=1 Tax=Candidatus Magasanikbacteria bacterium RIFCSPLOWO2_01_FULL_40_15 TaxID=1798686 RepID=A0A1F6N436_9BACT|nr:MAG: aspartate--tRNA ligase [Candidatus Magasanikbacteria bacterium RIFCSPHIGHO2_01_FULL_41_23]OGH67141.1 MAG: aspartate--tRNA ligase [Candidatus Magasanikbacteria bacterium RIFCSPHIGHO2_02_FULL_41_35]OGH76729.1 MAG: aspartate--tRNA ligase [Candidatus Magasanikbacteria bacterium RIFCSPHIGHO2_12_FULL_41_16]OGH78677.1 MAG: aspartate--tRNA ligase [Candidatus Magasanikbacteria bacterium RIFCSPLOWO2_01_FULL_40_15]